MRAVFITESSQEIGIGHLKRCFALATEFANERDLNIEIIVPEINRENLQILQDSKFIYFSINDRLQSLRNEKTQDMLFIVDVITSFYDQFIEEFSNKNVKIFGIDDFTHRNVNYTANFAPPTSVMPGHFTELQKTSNFIGWNWVPIQNELWVTAKLMPKNKEKNVLLLFGGSDAGGLSLPSCKHFGQSSKENQFTLICGPLMPENIFEACKTVENEFANIEVLKSPSNLYELMARSFFSITSFGHTFYELIALKSNPFGIYRDLKEVAGLYSYSDSIKDFLIPLSEYTDILSDDLNTGVDEFWALKFKSMKELNPLVEELSLQLRSGCLNIKSTILSSI